MAHISINKESRVVKNEKGIWVDDKLVLLKNYLIYFIMYHFHCKTKSEAQLIYDAQDPVFLMLLCAREDS